MFYSPLRYPGGKNKLASFLAKICVDNNVTGHYVEPFAGGASVALFLLFEGFVNRITINDKDRSIFAFWYSVLNDTDRLCSRIENIEINIEEWRRQRDVQNNKDNADLLDLGFSTLFLNRTSRSGIITAGAIGGVSQMGKYKIDCRFNKEEIVKRIRNISSQRDNIQLYNIDALDLIDIVEREIGNNVNNNTIFYFDPPYYLKASTLYMSHYKDDCHKAVSDKIKEIRNIRWIVSYDNVPQIRELYRECAKKEYSFKHTAYDIRIGQEILFFSNNINQPELDIWTPIGFSIKKGKTSRNLIYRDASTKKIIHRTPY